MTCHGRGKCRSPEEVEAGAAPCECIVPYVGPTCLHDACLDIYACRECAASPLGCYFLDGECRGDGLRSPDESACPSIFWKAAWQYLQFVVLFAMVLAGAGCLVWRSRRAHSSSASAVAFQPIPMEEVAGNGEWGWDGNGTEEDHVELLGEKRSVNGGTPNKTTRATGIYALARPPPAASASSSLSPSLSASRSSGPGRLEAGGGGVRGGGGGDGLPSTTLDDQDLFAASLRVGVWSAWF